MGNEGLCTVTRKKNTVAEAPEDTDAGEACIAGGLDIDIAIADVNGGGTHGSSPREFSHSSEDGVRSRLATDAGSLILTNGDFDGVGEEMVAKFLGGCHHFIADHSKVATTGFESGQSLRNAVVGARGVEGVRHVILAEGVVSLVEKRIPSTIWHSPFHEFPDTIAHEPPHIVERMLRHVMGAEGVIDRSRQIA